MVKRLGETSYKETAFGIVPRSVLIEMEVEGIKRAWDEVLCHALPIPFSIPFLLRLHHLGFGWIFPEFGGKFRTIDVQVSKHNPPKFFLVRQLMEDFCRDVQMRLKHLPVVDTQKGVDELVAFLSWTHHRFLWIHPFQDHNGRIARLLINVLLLNLHLPPIELAVETTSARRDYIRALSMADSGEFSALERLLRKALEEAARKV